MTNDIWLISDTHFNQATMLEFTDWSGAQTRPGFRDVEHMDDLMIDNWNSVVKPNDTIYHLGDLVAGPNPKKWMINNWHRLNGNKELVIGNHDNIEFLSTGGFFDKMQYWKVIIEFGIILSHAPLHRDALVRPKAEHGERAVDKKNMDLWTEVKNVHGHIHSNPSPEGPYTCVSVEHINYTPVNIDEVRE
tara:strand:- start:1540 stop:2109 length:570 start_codon:yes stop_codon:yes gene_type:complete